MDSPILTDCPDGFRAGRGWSLWEMINYQFSLVAARIAALVTTEQSFRQRVALAQTPLDANSFIALARRGISRDVTERDIEQAQSYIAGSTGAAKELDLPTVAHRVEQFKMRLRDRVTVADLYAEYRALRQAYGRERQPGEKADNYA